MRSIHPGARSEWTPGVRPVSTYSAASDPRETGPLRVRRELAERLRRLAERGLLRIDDADLAAVHLMLLISTAAPSPHGSPRTEQEITELVTAGVRTFLHGHAHPRQEGQATAAPD
jgi:hypothetical protein